MDSLFTILSDKNFDEPPEMSSVKKYMQDEFKADVPVQVRDKDIVVTVPNAAMAGALRMRVPEMKRRCQLSKRVTIRIGG